ncbi:transcriptional regulator with XRE-family HTH domain [Nocardioides sp. BE266]|uniref:helix-turn-helix transcriptional regulator n=1 Tax=Nocardioides sp. BE266 TaxID=2817725 RepID=UPI00285A68BE|nr:helix-turn-helix transcriptional regulator [Nocardioides sp. BE266]MDR7251646.1 transcriptional regulator with XRE-family HTH domain [Nocardioides sp. BE266]
MDSSGLATQLRLWRDRTSPASVGLPSQPRRRAPGLRREEVAQLAGISGDYLVRLEQGRAQHPSVQVVQSLARALRLDDIERDVLYRLAGHLPPSPSRIQRHVPPSVMRLVDRLGDTPVSVIDASWQTILQNQAATALFGDLSGESERGRNRAWRTFMDLPGMGRFEPQTRSMVERDVVADLRAALLRLPDDPDLASLVRDLREQSPRFAELWETTPAKPRGAQRKTLHHPVVGWMTLDCDKLTVNDGELQIVVFTAEPGTPDAEALALAVVIGLQEMEAVATG